MSVENLLLERDGAVAVVPIGRPRVLNALHSSTTDPLRRAVPDLTHDVAVRAVVAGAGETALIAGGDIDEPAAEPAAKAPVPVRHIVAAVGRGLETSRERGRFPGLARFSSIASPDDMCEGTTACFEGRQPCCTGR